MKKIEVFEKAIAAEQAVLEKGKETEYYKKYNRIPDEFYEKAAEARKALGCPSTQVLRAYFNKRTDGLLVVDNFWSNQIGEVLETLETGKVKEFFMDDHSTALMGEIHGLAKGGWKFEAAEIDDPYPLFSFEKEKEKVRALRFTKK